jgi:hypothetical protein
MSTRVGHLNWHGGRQYASWSLKMSSSTMRRFSMTRSEWVVMTMPGSICVPQLIGVSSLPATSTTQMRQAPYGASFGS